MAPSPSPSPGLLIQPQITLPSKSIPNRTQRILQNMLSLSPKTMKSSKRALSPTILHSTPRQSFVSVMTDWKTIELKQSL